MQIPAAYATAVLILSGLACFSLTTHVHSRWLAARGASFAAVHCALLAVIAGAGLFVVAPARLRPRSLDEVAVALPAGAVAGWLSIRADRSIVRFLARRGLLRGRRGSDSAAGRAARTVSPAVRPVPMAIGGGDVSRRSVGLIRSEAVRPYAGGSRKLLAAFVVSGALEEIVFRGLLLQIALEVEHRAGVIAAVAGLTAMFSLGHLFFGWTHVIAKTPLSILTTAVALACGTVIAAVTAHVLFNFAAAVEARDHAVAAPRDEPPRFVAWIGGRALER